MARVGEEPFLISLKNKVRTVKFNRPQKKNAFSMESYRKLTNLLNEDAENDDVVVTILTGAGDFYSSGTEIHAIDVDENPENAMRKRNEEFKKFVDAFIRYPKLLIAVVNGPAIGIAVTSLALCDVVYASDKATFQTPFVNIGLSPEGCSSYLFPLILGRSKASEMLLLGHKMTADEAYQFNFISKVISHAHLDSFIESLHKYGNLSVNTVKNAKELIKRDAVNILHKVNETECDLLIRGFQSEEFIKKVIQFIMRKNKSQL